MAGSVWGSPFLPKCRKEWWPGGPLPCHVGANMEHDLIKQKHAHKHAHKQPGGRYELRTSDATLQLTHDMPARDRGLRLRQHLMRHRSPSPPKCNF